MQVLTHLAGAVCLLFVDMDKDCAIFRRQSLRQAAQMAGIVMCKDQIGYVQMLPALLGCIPAAASSRAAPLSLPRVESKLQIRRRIPLSS